jgi:PAS domain S-box-containing protein
MTSHRLVPLSEYHRLPQDSQTSDFYKHLLEVVCNNATLALFIMDEHQQCIYMNPAAETLTGYQLSETKGRALHDVIHHTRPDGRPYPLCECPIDQAFPKNNQEQGEEVFVHKDGHFYAVAYTASPIREGGQIIGTIIEVRDITQEKLDQQARQEATKREQALRQEAETTRQQLETVLSSISDGVFVLDLNWCYIYVNDRFCQMAGKSREELLGCNHWELFPEAIETEIDSQFYRAMHEQKPALFEYWDLYSNRWFEYRVYPSPQGITVFVAEITEYKLTKIALHRSEERLRVSQELSLDAFTILDSVRDQTGKIVDFVWTYVNPKAAEILKHPVEELVGERLLEVLPGNQLNSDLFKRYVRVVETGKPHDIELSYEADGITGWFRNMAVKLEDGIAIFFSDITERKRSEQALRESETIARTRAEELAALMEITPAAIWIAHDPQCHKVTANQAAYQLMRIESGGVATATPEDGNNPFRFKQCRNGQEVLTQDLPLQKAIGHGQAVTDELEFVFEDGAVHFLYGQTVPLYDMTGEIRGAITALVDISDYKRIEEALRTSEERLRFAVEGAALGTWEYDLASGKILWSERSKQMFGVSLDAEVDYDIFINVLHPDDQARIHAAVQRAITAQEIYDVEMRSIWADGSVHWIRAIGRAHYDHQGTATRMIGVAFDITERKHAEAALQKSEEQLRLATEGANLGMWYWDGATDTLSWTDRAKTMFGLPADTEISMPVFLETIHPEDRPLVQTLIHNAWVGQIPREVECRILWPNGSLRWILARGDCSYHADGTLASTRGIFMDITDRKQSEAALRESERRFRRLVESNMFGVAFGDFTGNIQYVNDYFLSMVGYSHAEFEAGQVKWTEITPPEFLPLDAKAMVELRTQGVATPFEKEFIRKDGSRVPILIGSALFQEPYDQQQEIIAFFVDLTERKQAEAERETWLQQALAAREEAETANRIKDEFLAVLSHELRSPLNPILGWSTLLLNQKLDPDKTTQALNTIARNAKLQAELIEDLLDVSRILRGKLSLNIRPVDLSSTIQAALETVRLSAEAKSIQIFTTLEDNVGLIAGDSSRLQQVIWNILSNAVKFTPAGGRIDIRLERLGTAAQISIRDTGKGIQPNFLPFVFDYFRQEDGATTRQFGGLGLGLAIVHHLVELHGGTIQAESLGEGQGATFNVRLPLMLNPVQVSQDSPVSESACNLTGIQVLVVEDDADTRDFVAFLLQRAGAIVITAASAKAALMALTRSQPDILISDIGMPDMDGYMLMRQVRALPVHQGGQIPAIALTAYAGEIDYQQAMAAGFQQHITKPIEPQVLIQAISRIVFNSAK